MVNIDKDVLIALAIIVVAIIGIVVVVIVACVSKESFSKAQRIKILSQSSMAENEGFVGSRSDMLFKGDFNHLLTKPEDKLPATSVPTMDSTVAKPVQQSAQLAATPAESSAAATDLAKQIATEVGTQAGTRNDVNVGPAAAVATTGVNNYELDSNVETHNEIVTTAGKVLPQEKFSTSRVYNDFSTILADTSMTRLSSKVAQSEEQGQKSIDMKVFEKKLN